ncbi:hypothetical protein LIER_28188 [Lithospermum erythrorhizon]|uniref:Uncharacterized protein n=1 Tax=Lithospermum erythrorhizon TaxID=34254 RepID=A0AAV3RGE9_LITER
MPDASLSNFRASSSNIGSDNLRPEIQGNIFPAFHPLRPISTTPAINHWQTSVEAPNMVGFQNNVGLGTYIPGHYHPQVLQKVNYGLGMAGESIMATEFVPEPIGVARVQEQMAV